MKRILLLSLLLLPIVALAQYPTFSNKQKLGVQTTGDGLIFRGTTINNIPNYTPSNVNNAYFHLDTTNNKLYLYNATAWQLVYPSPQFDTTTLNVYLKISDTTAMLLPYFRDSDTTSLNLINRFALKLNISDTATMLTPYMKKADTISLSNRINLKLNISDTTILSNRITTNANNIITINNKLATKLDTIYTKFKNVVKMIVNKDTINIGSSLTDGYAINIIGDSVNVDTTLLDIRYPDRDSTNELQDITFATTAGIVTISGGKVINLDTLYNSVIDSVNLLIRDSIAAFTPLTEGFGINIIGDSINIDTTIIFTQSDTITLSNRINLKLNALDTANLSNRIDLKLNVSDTLNMLNPYFRDADTIQLNLTNRFNTKLSLTDTASMLAPYLKLADTTFMLAPYFRDSDTTMLNLNSRFNLKLNATDTVSLSNRIDLKLNKSDTISLSNRIDIKLNASDTVSLSNRINKKLDTIYVNYQTSIDTIVNKDTINITTLEAGAGINITNNVISLDTTLLDSVVRVQNVYVKNGTGTVLNKGEAVYVTGANGTNIIVGRASNVAESSSSKTLGLTMTSIAINGFGYVVKEGLLAGLNTSAADSAGVPIWLGVNGALIYGLNNKPYAPNHLVYLGVVTRKQQNNGEVYVTVQNGFEIKELHDVQIIDPVNKASLYYNLSESLWRDTTAALLVSDTASMLNPYLRKLDTLSLSNRINLKFNTADTSILGYVTTYSNQLNINGNKTFNNTVSVDSLNSTKQAKIQSLTVGKGGIAIIGGTPGGISSTAFGFEALKNNTSGDWNTAIGYQTLLNNTTAWNNVAIGNNSLNFNTGGEYNTAVGVESLFSNKVGNNNVAIGYYAGTNNKGSNNIYIGNETYHTDSVNNVLMIGGVNTPLLSGIITGNKKLGVNVNPLNLTNTFEVNSPISDAVKINSNTNSTNLELMNSGGSVYIKSGNKNMTLQTDTTALVYLKGDVNRVGILTMNPQQALQVAGTIRVDSLGNNLTPVKLVGSNASNDLTDVKLGTGLSISNDTLKIADDIINSGDTATLLRQDFLGINTNVLIWQQGSKKLLPYFTQVYRNGQLLKSESQYTITNDSIVTLAVGSFKLDDNITIIAIDNIIALAGGGGIITLQGDVTGSGTNTITTTIGNSKVLNSMLAGSITNDKLDVITATNKVSNSATTATNNNTVNTIVSRDGSGNFSAGTITASLNGNANTSTTLATGRTIGITGDLTYTSPSFNGSANVTAVGTLANSGVTANTYTAATITVDAKGRITSASSNTIPTVNDGTLTMNVSGNGLTGSRRFTANQSTDSTFTVTSNATNVNTPSTIVYRDASGNFSAGNITATLTGNASTATNVAYSGLTGTVPTWNQNTTGNAATVTTNANLTGDITSTGNNTSIATGVIVNADINASAAIAVSKLAASTISGITLGNNLNTLTISSPLTGTSYNGSSAVTIGLQAATTSVAGSMSAADKSKLDGIAAGATANTGTVTSVAALTLTTTGTDITSSVATGTTTPVITLNIPNASTTNRGVLTSTDWTTFNSKQNALGFTPANSTITINTTSPLQGGGDLSNNRTLSILSASDSQSGIVTTTSQLFGGSKVFKNRVTVDSVLTLNTTTAIPNQILGINTVGNINSVGKLTLGNGLSITSSTLLVDTNLLVTRFDTTSMLTPYLRKADTSLLNLSSRFATKLNISDTAAMLSNYNSRINLKLNISDTTNMLLPYLKDADTTSLNLTSRFASKQNTISLTTNGTSGVTTFNGTILNVPNYTLSGLGGLSNSITSTQDGYFGNISLYDDNTPSHYLSITNSANLTAARTLSINVNDLDRNISLSGNLTVSNNATVSGTNTGDQTITLTGDVTGTGTSSFSTTLANSGVTANTYRSVTVDVKGRVTAGTNPTTLAGYGITNAVDTNRTITINGTALNLSANRSYSVGTVTSVGGTGTVSGLTLTGLVNTTGNLTLGGTLAVTPSNFASQTANTVLAAPNGSAGVPIFRTLVAEDIPILNQNTTGTSSSVTGTVNVINGGTGLTTIAAKSLIVANNTNVYTALTPNAGQSIRVNANNTAWESYTPFIGTDTVSLSNRINLRVNISDTLNMLLPYLRKADTTLMLTPYLRRADTSLLNLTSRFNTKQNTLVSGTNIKTVNSNSLLGSGNVSVGTVTNVTIASSTPMSITNNTTTPEISMPAASASVSGFLQATAFSLFESKQTAISLTTTGSSGAATFDNNFLNIPNYTLSGLGGVPTNRTITINGTTQDLSANNTYNVGTLIGTDTVSLSNRINLKFNTADTTQLNLTSRFAEKQNTLSGTGFVKASGTTISYDNSSYLTTGTAASTYLTQSNAALTYLPLSGGTLTGGLTGTTGTFISNNVPQLSLGISGNDAETRLAFVTGTIERFKIFSTNSTSSITFQSPAQESAARGYRFISSWNNDSHLGLVQDPRGNVGIKSDATGNDVHPNTLYVNGTLGVTGATTLSNTLGVTGITTLNNDLVLQTSEARTTTAIRHYYAQQSRYAGEIQFQPSGGSGSQLAFYTNVSGNNTQVERMKITENGFIYLNNYTNITGSLNVTSDGYIGSTLTVGGATTLSNLGSVGTGVVVTSNTGLLSTATTINQTGIMTTGNWSTSTGASVATFDVTHNLGVEPSSVIITPQTINGGATKIFYEVIGKTNSYFRVQAFNLTTGSPATNTEVSIYWIAIK